MEDEKILDLYWARSEQALTETQKRYGNYCGSIALSILGSRADSEECVNDTYWQAWRSIPPNRPTHLAAFLGRITRNLALDRLKHRAAKKRGGGQAELALEELQDCIPAESDPAGSAESGLLVQALNRFLEALPADSRILFLQRYWYFCPIRQMAAEHGLSQSAVKMSLLRTRKKLREFLEQEGLTQ